MTTKKIRRITDLGTLIQAIFADLAGAVRTVNAGADLTRKGELSAAVRVGEGATVWLFNSSVAVKYVAFGVQAMAAPTGLTDGIPVPAGQYLVLNSGPNAWVRSSDNTVYGFVSDIE